MAKAGAAALARYPSSNTTAVMSIFSSIGRVSLVFILFSCKSDALNVLFEFGCAFAGGLNGFLKQCVKRAIAHQFRQPRLGRAIFTGHRVA